MHHIHGAGVARRLQIGQPLDRAVSHSADQNRCIWVHLSDRLSDTRVELVPIVQCVPVLGVECLRLPDVQCIVESIAAHFVGIWFDHQVIADDDGMLPVAIGCMLPHLSPGVLRRLILPHRVIQIDFVKPVPHLIPEKGEFTASRPGTEADDRKHVRLGNHVQQPVQIVLDCWIQPERRLLSEKTGVGDVHIVGTHCRQPVEIILGVRRAHGSITHELGAIQFRIGPSLVDIRAAQLCAPAPQIPLFTRKRGLHCQRRGSHARLLEGSRGRRYIGRLPTPAGEHQDRQKRSHRQNPTQPPSMQHLIPLRDLLALPGQNLGSVD